jgi:hypothetical protein
LGHCRAQAGHHADQERAGRNTEHAELLFTDLNLRIFKRTWANPAAPDFAFNQIREVERRLRPEAEEEHTIELQERELK